MEVLSYIVLRFWFYGLDQDTWWPNNSCRISTDPLAWKVHPSSLSLFNSTESSVPGHYWVQIQNFSLFLTHIHKESLYREAGPMTSTVLQSAFYGCHLFYAVSFSIIYLYFSVLVDTTGEKCNFFPPSQHIDLSCMRFTCCTAELRGKQHLWDNWSKDNCFKDLSSFICSMYSHFFLSLIWHSLICPTYLKMETYFNRLKPACTYIHIHAHIFIYMYILTHICIKLKRKVLLQTLTPL